MTTNQQGASPQGQGRQRRPAMTHAEAGRRGGKALAKAERERLGEEGYRQKMQALGRMGGRPTWEQALQRAKEQEEAIKARRRGPGRPRKGEEWRY